MEGIETFAAPEDTWSGIDIENPTKETYLTCLHLPRCQSTLLFPVMPR